jgi:hypothetical protein
MSNNNNNSNSKQCQIEVFALLDKEIGDLMKKPVSSIIGDSEFNNLTVEELFEKANSECSKNATTGGKKKGHKGGAVVSAAFRTGLKLTIILGLAGAIYFIYNFIELDKANCFSSVPWAYLRRTVLQNAYCDVLKGTNNNIEKFLRESFVKMDIFKLVKVIFATTTVGLVTYNTIVKYIQKSSKSIDTIVDYFCSDKDVNYDTAFIALRDIFHKGKPLPRPEPNSNNNGSQSSGGKAKPKPKPTTKPKAKPKVKLATKPKPKPKK